MKLYVPRVVVMALAVATVTVWMHWPSVSGLFITGMDDDVYLKKAMQFRGVSVEGILWAFTARESLHAYYQPLTWLTHFLDYQLWGLWPVGHHSTSVLFHGLNSALVVMLAWLIFETVPEVTPGNRAVMAFGVGLLFGIHPLQVEPVAWVSERKSLLCAAFILGCLSAYIRAAQQSGHSRWRWAMGGLFVGALLCKPMAVPLPAVMLAMDFYPLRRYQSLKWWQLVKEKVPWFALSAAVAGLTILGTHQVGSLTALTAVNPMERCLVALRGIGFYLWKFVWPGWLSPFYPLQGFASGHDMEFVAGGALLMAVSLGALWARNRMPAVLVAWMVYLTMLLPVSGLVQAGGQSAADRYMYVAMLPVLLLAAGGCDWLWRHTGKTSRFGLALLLCVYAAFLSWRTREQILAWHSAETLWRKALLYYPQSFVANSMLAAALAEQDRFSEALPHAQQAMQVYPQYAPYHIQLGQLYIQVGEEAMGQYQLALGCAMQGRFSESLGPAKKAVQSSPDSVRARALLGLVYLKTQQYEKAVVELQEGLRRDPNMFVARYNLACAFSRLQRYAEAYETLRQLLTSAPQYGRLVVRDSELAGLRDNKEFIKLMGELVEETGEK